MAQLGTKVPEEAMAAPTGEWLRGPLLPTISEQEVHIWKIDLTRNFVSDLESVLSEDELQHAARFPLGRDQRRFQAARSALRIILGRYLNLDPQSLVLGQTEYGKPFLTNPEANGLLFNLSYFERAGADCGCA